VVSDKHSYLFNQVNTYEHNTIHGQRNLLLYIKTNQLYLVHFAVMWLRYSTNCRINTIFREWLLVSQWTLSSRCG